ncbi:MAG: copper chaperone PCu(A)C [Burkholderiaceae bacterium]|jgi:copper(I)-binding protein|nr:copper chaperone PCu(A)C [Burkholderiaceae bacterium]
MLKRSAKRFLMAAALLAAGMDSPVWAQSDQPAPADPCGLKIQAPWVRATVPGQRGTGAFMRLTASQSCRLMAVQTPIAGVAQVHRMTMKDGVMHMRALESALPLPAGQTVTLAPGGLHLMLMDLKQPVAAGAPVPITLTVQNQQTGARGQITLDAPVRALDADSAGAAPGGKMTRGMMS